MAQTQYPQAIRYLAKFYQSMECGCIPREGTAAAHAALDALGEAARLGHLSASPLKDPPGMVLRWRNVKVRYRFAQGTFFFSAEGRGSVSAVPVRLPGIWYDPACDQVVWGEAEAPIPAVDVLAQLAVTALGRAAQLPSDASDEAFGALAREIVVATMGAEQVGWSHPPSVDRRAL